MDSLLGTLVILLIMAASSWLQRKAEEQQQRKPPARPPMRPPVGPPPPRGAAPQAQTPPKPVQKIDWQEELRRLLQGDVPPAEPPPVIVREAQPPAPPPVVSTPKLVPRPAVLAEVTEEGPQSSRLTEASAAYKKAQQLHDAAAIRLQRFSDHSRHDHSGKIPIQSKVRSPEIAAARLLLRNPSSVRQAFISSIVFNPPKGLEN
ncbi:MAG: hypothetical protein FJ398_05690 [Verrucomicrobia bacterium]|nr:hypothetical protein [Verrucomicrobiota bacterium]